MTHNPQAFRARLLFAEAALAFVVFVWGVNPVVMKLGIQFLPPQSYNLARMMIASAVALTALWLSGSYRRPNRNDWGALLRIAALGFFPFQLLITEGLARTTAGNASFIMCLLPVGVALFNRWFGLENITRAVLAGIASSVLGVALIVAGSGKEFSLAGGHLWGALLVLAAEAGYAYYTVRSKDLLARYSGYQVTAILMVMTTMLLFCATLPSVISVRWHEVPAVAWGSVAFSGIFALCVCNFLWIRVTAILGTSRVAVFHNLLPLFAVAAAYLLLDETFGLIQAVGAAFILLGVYITRRPRAGGAEQAAAP